MAPINQPADLINEVRDLRRQLDELRRTVGLSSATINRGGLSLLNDAFLKIVDASGVTRFFVGGSTTVPLSDGSPQPVIFARDANGKLRFAIYDPDPITDGYQPVFWVWDHLDNIAFTSDKNGGVAEPWISVPLYPAMPLSSTGGLGQYANIAASNCTGGVAWEGRIGKVSHPRIQIDGIWGRASGSNALSTYTLEVGGTDVGTWNESAITVGVRGPYDISAKLGQSNLAVKLKVSASGTGTDQIAIQPYGVWMRQSP